NELPAASELPMLTRKDFVSDQEVRWCPGCGDYSILAQTQKVMPDFGYPKENIVFISGIGCSGRLPYYMNTYGFHTIHGRALAIALAAEASFIARSVDTHTEHLQQTLEGAGRHRGAAFVEVLQNCNIFNDGAFREFTDREVREDRTLQLQHGEPMIFGKDRDK